MVHIVVVEQHLLLRLGLGSLMACLVSSDRIRTQSHDDLYRSDPHTGSTNLVLLSVRSEDRVNLLIQAVRRAHAPKRIILLSGNATCPSSWGALPPQVAGYLSVNAHADVILSTVQSLLRKYAAHAAPAITGEPVAANPSLPVNFDSHVRPSTYFEKSAGIDFKVNEAVMLGLSSRQYEVLVLLAQGLPIKLICRHLNISMATTKGHVEAVYQRLNVHNRNEAVFVALARGARLKMSKGLGPDASLGFLGNNIGVQSTDGASSLI